MLALPTGVRIWFHATPTDMRKSFNGLCGLIDESGLEPTSGDLFVFVNRTRDRMKILHFEGDGLAIWYKQLEAGRFQWPTLTSNTRSIPIDAYQLRLILDGVDLQSARRRKRYNTTSSK